MRRLIHAICSALLLLTGGLAHAHGGYETETEVRIYPDRMRIVTRSSLAFAWRILDNDAPAEADETGRAIAQPYLATLAETLFEVTAGGIQITPTKTDCVYEIEGLDAHAAFTLDFERPAAWPVSMKATFFPLIGELDTGTIAIFDHTAAPFQRDTEPLLDKSISRQSPSISFDLSPPKPSAAPASSTAPVTPAPVAPIIPPAKRFPLPIAIAVVLLIVGTAWRLSKRNPTGTSH